ncbi:MAG TPA: PASTA domain-containing protein [Solirubrobacterales bacterium]|jgi:hypothetical protein|nr:PASTA domain-containing protein [Solirubrobacterales bacterium]
MSEREALIERADGTSEQIWARGASDADGAPVPTTIGVSKGDVITLTVPYLDGGFVYPVTESPWILISEGSIDRATLPAGELERAERVIEEANPYIPHYERKTAPTAPGSGCRVPKLSGLTRRAAATKLRAAHCAIGKVHLAAGASAGKGKVVKQFRAAGAELAAGAPVAVKLGPGS